MLCSPYFQYPSKVSQIYAQAISHNVCLFSWEHLIFLIDNNIKETADFSFSLLWNFSNLYSRKVLSSDMKQCFINAFNSEMLGLTGLSNEIFQTQLEKQIKIIKQRGTAEKSFWEMEISKINSYTKEEAILELIKSKKIYEKIAQIDTYIQGIKYNG